MKSPVTSNRWPGFSAILRPDAVDILVIIAFGLLFAAPHIGQLTLVGNDSDFHIARYFGTWRAWQSGQIIPQLDPAFYGGFGYAPNLFYPPLTAYLGVLTSLITPNWNLAINLAVVLTHILAGIAMYFLVKGIDGYFSDAGPGGLDNPARSARFAGVISAIAYMSAPYLLVNSQVRIAAGEFLAMVFIPLILLAIWKIAHFENGAPSESAWLMLGLTVGGLLLTHNLSVAIFAGFGLIFLLVSLFGTTYGNASSCHSAARSEARQNAESQSPVIFRICKQLLLAGSVAFGLSAFFLLPLIEARGAAMYNVFLPNFMSNASLVQYHAQWSFANAFIPNGNIPYAWIGLLPSLALVCLPFTYRHLSPSFQKFIIIGLALTAISFVLMSPLIPWAHLSPAFWVIQFPWRLNVVGTVFLSAISGIVIGNFIDGRAGWASHRRSVSSARLPIPVNFARITALVLVGTVALGGVWLANLRRVPDDAYIWNDHQVNYMVMTNWGRSDYLPSRVINYVPVEPGLDATWFGEFEHTIDRSHDPIALTGSVQFSDFTHYGRKMQFTATVSQGGIVELPVFFYPGWRATVQGVQVPVFESDNGFAAIVLPNPGEYVTGNGGWLPAGGFGCTNTCEVTAEWGLSPATRVGALTTAATLLGLLAYAIVTRRRASRFLPVFTHDGDDGGEVSVGRTKM